MDCRLDQTVIQYKRPFTGHHYCSKYRLTETTLLVEISRATPSVVDLAGILLGIKL